MVLLVGFLLFQLLHFTQAKEHLINIPDGRFPLNFDLFVINARIPDVHLCQPIDTDQCRKLFDQMIRCQQIIFNDPGFSYQQYTSNIDLHRQYLLKYQSICEGTTEDYLASDSSDSK